MGADRHQVDAVRARRGELLDDLVLVAVARAVGVLRAAEKEVLRVSGAADEDRAAVGAGQPHRGVGVDRDLAGERRRRGRGGHEAKQSDDR